MLCALCCVPSAVHPLLCAPSAVCSDDELQVHAIAPDAVFHRDGRAAGTVEALTLMAHSDILVMGPSGFSWWGGFLSCGLKVGSNAMGAVACPLRHNASLLNPTATPQRMSAVLASTTSANRSSAIAHVFEEQERAFLSQVPTLRRDWRAYWSCKQRPTCHDLCAVTHLSKRSCWTRSGLVHDLVMGGRRNLTGSVRSGGPQPEPPALRDLYQWRRPPLGALLNVSGVPSRIVQFTSPTRIPTPGKHAESRSTAGADAWNDLARSAEAATCRVSTTVGASRSARNTRRIGGRTHGRASSVDVSCVNALWRRQIRKWRSQLTVTANVTA